MQVEGSSLGEFDTPPFLEDVRPVSATFEDVATPFESLIGPTVSPKGAPVIEDNAFDQQGDLFVFDAGTEILHKVSTSTISPKGAFDCNESGPDGFLDLVLKYDTQEVLAAVEASLGREVEDGEVLTLTLTRAVVNTGSTFVAGEDVVVIKKKGK